MVGGKVWLGGAPRLLRVVVGFDAGVFGQVDHLEKLPPECVADEAVDDKVDAGVENVETVGDVGEAPDPPLGEEGVVDQPLLKQVVALDDVVEVGELPDVDDDARHLATEEHNHDAQEDEEEIDLLPQPAFRSEPLHLDIANVHDDLGVENEHRKDGYEGGAEDSAPHDIVLDVVAVESEICWLVGGDSWRHRVRPGPGS